jgi:hypothetical protein
MLLYLTPRGLHTPRLNVCSLRKIQCFCDAIGTCKCPPADPDPAVITGHYRSLHDSAAVPNQHSLVPAGTRTPALCAKHAPVDAGHELGVAAHDAHLAAAAVHHGGVEHVVLLGAGDPHGATVGPHAACHIVARAEQNVGQVRRPGDTAHGILVARQHGDGPAVRGADVPGADQAVDAGGGNDRVSVLVPVVGEGLGGRDADRGSGTHARLGRGVDGHAEGEVVGSGGGSAQVEDAQVRVGAHAAEDARAVRAELGRVGARVRGQRRQARGGVGAPDLDGAVPAARQERVLADEVPVHGEDLAAMLVPRLHGELGQGDVEELDGAVAARRQQLVLVRLRPCRVEQRVLRVEPFLRNDAGLGQPQHVHAPVADEPKVGRRRDGDARVEEGRVLDAVAVVALRAVFEHGGRARSTTTSARLHKHQPEGARVAVVVGRVGVSMCGHGTAARQDLGNPAVTCPGESASQYTLVFSSTTPPSPQLPHGHGRLRLAQAAPRRASHRCLQRARRRLLNRLQAGGAGLAASRRRREHAARGPAGRRGHRRACMHRSGAPRPFSPEACRGHRAPVVPLRLPPGTNPGRPGEEASRAKGQDALPVQPRRRRITHALLHCSQLPAAGPGRRPAARAARRVAHVRQPRVQALRPCRPEPAHLLLLRQQPGRS